MKSSYHYQLREIIYSTRYPEAFSCTSVSAVSPARFSVIGLEKVLKEHDTSTQDQVNEQLNQLTTLLKALDGQANLVKEKDALSALTEEATALLASKPNHPSGDALQALVEKNKELLDSSELTPEALATAKQV